MFRRNFAGRGLMERLCPIFIVATIASATAGTAKAEASFEIYGTAQADYIQDFDRVDPNWASTLRPSKIAVPSGQFGSNGQSILSVKQSRFGVKGNAPVEGGED